MRISNFFCVLNLTFFAIIKQYNIIGDFMIVYADILILLNFLVNYFLLLTAKKINGVSPKLYRVILSSVLGAFFSLYIFLPPLNKALDLLLKLFACFLMTLICFGYKSHKKFLKAFFTVFGSTCLYAGIMIAVWHIFEPKGMVINNSVIYFNISPLFLIGFTVGFYFLFSIGLKIFSKSSKIAERCEVTLFADKKQTNFNAIIDTGNSLEDVFGNSEIIIAEKSVFYLLFGENDINNDDKLKKRYRIIPCTTIAGTTTLDGYRCDKAYIKSERGKITLEKPIIAISNEAINDDYEAILNPKIFN